MPVHPGFMLPDLQRLIAGQLATQAMPGCGANVGHVFNLMCHGYLQNGIDRPSSSAQAIKENEKGTKRYRERQRKREGRGSEVCVAVEAAEAAEQLLIEHLAQAQSSNATSKCTGDSAKHRAGTNASRATRRTDLHTDA